MSEFDPDNAVGVSGGAGFSTGADGVRELRQGGNVTSRLPGRQTFNANEGVGTTTVRDLKEGSSAPKKEAEVFTDMHGNQHREGSAGYRAATEAGFKPGNKRNTGTGNVEFDGVRWDVMRS